MYLLDWKSRASIFFLSSIILGGGSYLAGNIYLSSSAPVNKKNGVRSRNWMVDESSHFRLFDDFFKSYIFHGDSALFLQSSSKEIKNRYIVNKFEVIRKLRTFIRSKILNSFKLIYPSYSIEKEDIIGHIYYFWEKYNLLNVIVKFKLSKLESFGWYYDYFSILWASG